MCCGVIMSSIDEIMKYDGREVYPLICEKVLTDAANAMDFINELKASNRYQEDRFFRVSVDSGALVASGMQGDHDAVIAMAPDIINRADVLGLKKLVAANWNNLGTTYAALQNLERSLECYCHLINSESKYGNYGLTAMANYNLSVIFYDVGANEKAMNYIESAVNALKQLDKNSPAMKLRNLLFRSLYLQLLCRTGQLDCAEKLYSHLCELAKTETSRESIFAFRAAEMYYYFYTSSDLSGCEYYYDRLIELTDERDFVRKYLIIDTFVDLCESFEVDYSHYEKQLLLVEEMPDFHSYPTMTELYRRLRKYYLSTGQKDKYDETTEKYVFSLEQSQKSYRDQQREALVTVESIILDKTDDSSARNAELSLLANEAIQNKKLLEEAYSKLEKISSLDGLTHISGRREFEKRFLNMLQSAHKEGDSVSVFMMDIDYFKIYNDTYGHLEGDEVLKKVAVKFNDALESVGGVAARFGGEEFIGACTGLNMEETAALAERICECVRSLEIENVNTPMKYVTVSLGAAVSRGFTVDDKSRFMKMADLSLYEAKNSGRNRVVCRYLENTAE